MPVNLLDKFPKNLSGETVALMVLDPGTTNGLLTSYIDLDRKRPAWEQVGEGLLFRGDIAMRQYPEDELDCSIRIAKEYVSFAAQANMDGIPLNRIFFLIEDFVLYPGKKHSSVRSGISPARVTAMVQALLHKYDPQYMRQMASMAEEVTNQQLREWDLWYRGSEHCRMVTKHAVVWVRRALS